MTVIQVPGRITVKDTTKNLGLMTIFAETYFTSPRATKLR